MEPINKSEIPPGRVRDDEAETYLHQMREQRFPLLLGVYRRAEFGVQDLMHGGGIVGLYAFPVLHGVDGDSRDVFPALGVGHAWAER